MAGSKRKVGIRRPPLRAAPAERGRRRRATRRGCSAPNGRAPLPPAAAGPRGRRSIATGQRPAKRQPGGGAIGVFGGSPVSLMRRAARARPPCTVGTADSSASVYGCPGRANSAARPPRRLAQVHHRDAVADVLDDRHVVRDEEVVRPSSRCSSASRLRIWARIATSSADTGSSQTTSFGLDASARAMPMRWHWPPENSCGSGAAARAAGRPPHSSAHALACACAASPLAVRSSGSDDGRRVMRGSSEANGSWKMICMSRRARRSARLEPQGRCRRARPRRR